MEVVLQMKGTESAGWNIVSDDIAWHQMGW